MKVLKPYINIWVIATSHHLGPQKLAFFQGNPIISGKSRLVKYYTVIWPDGIFQQKIFQLFLVNVNFPTPPTRYPGAGSLQGTDFSSLVQQGAEKKNTGNWFYLCGRRERMVVGLVGLALSIWKFS